MKSASSLPGKLADITADWLSDVLRTAGLITQEQVQQFTPHPAEVEGGHFSDTYVLDITYDDESTTAPKHIILKLPVEDPEKKLLSLTLNFYQREIDLYKVVLPSLKWPYPRCYYGEYDRMSFMQKFLGVIFNASPHFLRPFEWPILSRVLQDCERNFVVLIEYSEDAYFRKLQDGATQEETMTVMASLAKFHAASWGIRKSKYRWIRDLNRGKHHVQLDSNEKIAIFLSRYPELFDEDGKRQTKALSSKIIKLYNAAVKPPYSLVHGAARLENIYFSKDEQGERQAIIFDWQTVQYGSPLNDVWYFLLGSLNPQEYMQWAKPALAHYYQALAECGVSKAKIKKLKTREDDIRSLQLIWSMYTMANLTTELAPVLAARFAHHINRMLQDTI